VTSILFESTITLAIFAALVNFGLLVYWRKARDVKPLLIALGVTAVLFVVQSVVVTTREHVERILSQIEKDLVASRVDALEQALAPKFSSGNMDRDAFVEFARSNLERVQIHWLRRSHLQVRRASRDLCTASVGYVGDVTAEGYVGRAHTRWSITFIREDGQWRISGVDPPTIMNTEHRSWKDFAP